MGNSHVVITLKKIKNMGSIHFIGIFFKNCAFVLQSAWKKIKEPKARERRQTGKKIKRMHNSLSKNKNSAEVKILI